MSTEMNYEPTPMERLAQMLARAFEEYVAPLRAEIGRLGAEVERLRARSGDAAPAAPRPSAPIAPIPTARPAAVALRRAAARPVLGDQSCLVPDCPAPVLAKQLCETHYRVMRRAASAGEAFDPRRQRPASVRVADRTCSVADCTEAHYAKGLCRRHYMAARARFRAGGPGDIDPTHENQNENENSSGNGHGSVERDDEPRFAVGGVPESNIVAMPTKEIVQRVLDQNRGGLDKVAEILGRNRHTLMDLFDHLGLTEYVVKVRETERKRATAAPLHERLSDLLYHEKLLKDLDCIKDVDERTRNDILRRVGDLGQRARNAEEVLDRLQRELKLEETGFKRLVYRYDLRRHLREMKLRSTTPPTRLRT